MDNIMIEPVDFKVTQFQDYLTEQTQHVNMSEQNCPSSAGESQSGEGEEGSEAQVEEGSEIRKDGWEKTLDGNYKCSYCSYANKKARLLEHIRIHTGEKPHHCHLCSFTSAYGRNISRHEQRCHELPPSTGGERSPPSKKKRSLPYGRRLIVKLTPPKKKRAPKSDDPIDLSRELHHPLHNDEYKDIAKKSLDSNLSGSNANSVSSHDPPAQMSTIDCQLTYVPPVSPDGVSKDEKPPIVTQHQVLGLPLSVSTNGVQTSPQPEVMSLAEVSHSLRFSHSQPGTPDQDQPQKCLHCDVHFGDNILHTIHMGCHGYEHPFQCNICGHTCRDKYDFACHFARGKHTE